MRELTILKKGENPNSWLIRLIDNVLLKDYKENYINSRQLLKIRYKTQQCFRRALTLHIQTYYTRKFI